MSDIVVLNKSTPAVVVTSSGGTGPAGPAGSGSTVGVQEESTLLGTAFSRLKFTGAGVTASDATGGVAQIDIPGGSGGEALYLAEGVVVADGTTVNSAAAVEASALAAFGANRGGTIIFPQGASKFDRRIIFDRPHRVIGYGQGSEDWATTGSGPTVLLFPYGSGSGIRFKHGPGGTGVGSVGAQRGSLSDLRIEFYGTPASDGVANYSGAGSTTITVTSGSGNFANGQVVLLEGAGVDIVIPDRTFAMTSGSNVATITVSIKDELGGTPNLGNAISYVGQPIKIAGAGAAGADLNGFVGTWAPGSVTIVNSSGAALNASTTVTVATATIKTPIIAEIQSGGGTGTLTIDNPYFGQAVTGGKLRHADCGVYATCTINMTNVEINVQGSSGALSAGGGIDLFLRGSTTDQSNADNCLFINCKFTGGNSFAGVVMEGYDAQVNTFVHCNFAGPKVGVLDQSSLGSSYEGKCHWAFNVGIMISNYSAHTTITGGYFESGTSWMAPPSCQALAINTTSVTTGSGFQSISNAAGDGILAGFVQARRVSSSGGAHLGGSKAVWMNGLISSSAGAAVGMPTGAGWSIGGTGGGGVGSMISYATPDGAFANGIMTVLANLKIGTSFGGQQCGRFDATSVNHPTSFTVNDTKVVGARGASLPADATDLATALTLVNAIKARMKATGGHGLVAD